MEYAISTDGGATYGQYISLEIPNLGGNKVVKVRYKNPLSAEIILYFTANFGDINADGIIDIYDVLMCVEIAAGNTGYSNEQILRANVSDKLNLTVDISDVILLIQRVVGNTAPFPIDLP